MQFLILVSIGKYSLRTVFNCAKQFHVEDECRTFCKYFTYRQILSKIPLMLDIQQYKVSFSLFVLFLLALLGMMAQSVQMVKSKHSAQGLSLLIVLPMLGKNLFSLLSLLCSHSILSFPPCLLLQTELSLALWLNAFMHSSVVLNSTVVHQAKLSKS